MANETKSPSEEPGKGTSPEKKRGPTEQPETDSSGDPLDGTGEDNHQAA